MNLQPHRQRALAILTLVVLTTSSCAYVARVSSANTPEVEPDGESFDPAMSRDGRFVAFASYAENLVVGDTNGQKDIFLRDNQLGQTSLITQSTAGGPANGLSGQPDISADGRFVAYWSFADDLVAGDINNQSDVFLHDRQANTTERVSVDSAENEAVGGSLGGSVSDDGQKVTFYTTAALVPTDTNGDFDIYVRDRQAGTTTLVSNDMTGGAAGSSFDPVIARDGNSIAYWSNATDITAGDTNGFADVFAKSLSLNTTVNFTGDGNGNSYTGDITTGPFPSITYSSEADNLVGTDTNGVSDVFLEEWTGFGYDRKRITHGDGWSGNPVIAVLDPLDGAKIAFVSGASDLQEPGAAPLDTNGFTDVYLWERLVFGPTRTRLMSQSIGAGLPNAASFHRPALSSNGAAVAYPTFADNISFGDSNGFEDIYVRPVRVPRIDSITGTLQVGATSTVTLLGEFDPTGSSPDDALLRGDGIVSQTVDDVTYFSITVTVELDTTATPGPRDLWVHADAPALGIPAPLGSGDRIAVDVLP